MTRFCPPVAGETDDVGEGANPSCHRRNRQTRVRSFAPPALFYTVQCHAYARGATFSHPYVSNVFLPPSR